jgi:DNA-binding IclR family transcriptional regulator
MVQDALPARILRALKKTKEPISARQVAHKAGGDTASTAVALVHLKKRGLVVRLGRSQYVAAGMDPSIKE